MTKKKSKPAPSAFVSYIRVSTAMQGRSGLGLDAQRAAIRRYVAGRKLLGEFREVESGRNKDRPELKRALALCRETGAELVIARLDRLARNVLFIAALMESGVAFRALDIPEANPLVLHVLAAVAEAEAKAISERTKGALGRINATLAAKGTYRTQKGRLIRRLGNPRAAKCAHLGGAGRAKVADRFALDVWPQISRLRSAGITSPAAVAAELQHWKISTPSGGANTWTASMIRRVLRRVAGIEASRPAWKTAV
jgi:DNA invertase Pin-like site-specific DNA recombinase